MFLLLYHAGGVFLDPYRLFFPLGALAAILGTIPWVSFGFGISSFYPGLFHSDLMIGGFLFAFSAGFLMTAVPQFTGSLSCRAWELASSVALFIALLAASFLKNRTWFHLISLAALVHLVQFCVQRVVRRAHAPPRFFIFVGLGLLMGICGAALLASFDLGWSTDSTLFALAKIIYTQGMVLSLILGVGTHLLPAIWGWTDLPTHGTKLAEDPGPAWKMMGAVLLLATVLFSSFVTEASWNAQAGYALRAALVTFLAISRWKILRKPKARGRVAFWLWLSAWSLLLGLWAPVLAPAYAVHGLHLAFIGGFGLMTFMVAARVSLVHGGYGHRTELRSRWLTAAAIILLVAGATRALAPLLPSAYLHHLAYAAGTWILGVAIWSGVFIPKMLRLRKP